MSEAIQANEAQTSGIQQQASIQCHNLVTSFSDTLQIFFSAETNPQIF